MFKNYDNRTESQAVPSTSLIISTYNWPAALHCCLQSVANQKIFPVEVIIADDGSGNSTKSLIETMKTILPVPIKHIWHEDNGFRKSLILNKAVKSAVGDYIVQIDGDVILNRFFIRDHMAVAEPGAFVRGTRAKLTPEKTRQVLDFFSTNIHFLSKGVYHRLNAIRFPFFRFLGERKEMKCRSVRGCNLAYWKADFVKVNGYNNELQGWGHEDEELAARFINNSIVKKIVKLHAVQFHLHHKELKKDNEPFHATVLKDAVVNKTKTCINGYNT